ncbi:hypothetical protein HJC23_007646 [Cyclotella cryptica]|uniref:Uncharacterized protein n=1 Tax=Cyclotella cryptica TaxID=29204 RepID=A0ABD3P7K8_9STRA
MEVYLHNPWLTYGIGLHRLREAGLGTELMDHLDELSFSLDEIHEFCIELFVGKSIDVPLQNPCHDFPGFVSDLQNILKREKLVWNPVKNMLCPWIDIEKLKKMFRRASLRGGSCRRESYCRDIPAVNTPRGGFPKRKPRAEPTRQDFRRSQTMHIPQATPPPKRPFVRANSTDYGDQRKHASNATKANGFRQPVASAGPKDLNDAILKWSHKPPDFKFMHPLERLLVEVPTLFPASNNFVEDHDYFNRWKEFSEDAFSGEDGEELKELLRRAVRKAKFFLHPDKLPRDLTENQSLLFKAIWNVIQESEAVTL